MSPGELALLISNLGGSYPQEPPLRDAIAKALTYAGVAFSREAKIGHQARADFLVGRIAVEVKIAGSLSEVTRQLFRYAECDIDGIVLVTTRVQLARVPPIILGKPTAVSVLWGAML